jgi:hypothetical protein
MLRSLGVCLLLVACQGETAPAPDLMEPLVPAVASVEIAVPRMLVGGTMEEIESGATASRFFIGDLRGLSVMVRFPTTPPAEVTLDVVGPWGTRYARLVRPVEGHDAFFVIPVAGTWISRKHLAGDYTLVATIPGDDEALVTTTVELVDGVSP